jgi:hypothetical protein
MAAVTVVRLQGGNPVEEPGDVFLWPRKEFFDYSGTIRHKLRHYLPRALLDPASRTKAH